jgi:hypothetical protein
MGTEHHLPVDTGIETAESVKVGENGVRSRSGARKKRVSFVTVWNEAQ